MDGKTMGLALVSADDELDLEEIRWRSVLSLASSGRSFRPIDPSAPRFRYSDRVYYLRHDSENTWSLVCPVCEVRRALRPPAFSVKVTAGEVDIEAPIFCPERDCGWYVRIRNGTAIDLVR